MQLIIDVLKPKIETIVDHCNERLIFPAMTFTRDPFEKGFNPFEEINLYWSQQDDSFQDEVFQVFKDVYTAFDTILNADELYTELNILIGRLLALHPLDKLELWLRLSPTIIVPDTVKDTLPDPTDNTKTPGKTYTLTDYYRLLALSMFMRCLVPVWGEYIANIRKAAGSAKKEFIAVKLLEGTGVLECEAVRRLQIYIDELTKAGEEATYDFVMEGFAPADIPRLMLSLVLVRKICLADLRGSNPQTQAVASIWKFLMHRVTSAEDSSVKVKEPRDEAEGSGGKEPHSNIEAYRRRFQISFGDVAEFELQLGQEYDLAVLIEPDLPYNVWKESRKSIKHLEVENVGDAQLLIAGWVIKDIITPHSVYYVEKELPSLLAAVESVLWWRGFKNIATIVSSQVIVGVEDVSIGYSNTREQIHPEVVDEMKKYFPFVWGNARRKSTPVQHDVLGAIDYIADQLFFNSWGMTMSDRRIIEVFGEKRRTLIIPSNIKTELCKLIIDIEQRRETSVSNR